MLFIFLHVKILQGFLPFNLAFGGMAQLFKLILLLLGLFHVLCDADARYQEHRRDDKDQRNSVSHLDIETSLILRFGLAVSFVHIAVVVVATEGVAVVVVTAGTSIESASANSAATCLRPTEEQDENSHVNLWAEKHGDDE
jgi:hypothetical protein